MHQIRAKYKPILIIILSLWFSSISAKDAVYNSNIDKAIFFIYNMDFNQAENEIQKISIQSPETAQFLRLEYSWWEMISIHTEKKEAAFLENLNSVMDEKEDSVSNYNKLFYYTYRIRYDNIKGRYFSKMTSIFKFHLFLNQWIKEEDRPEDSFIESFKQLTFEMNNYMKYRFLDKFNLSSNKNSLKETYYLKKIEELSNPQFDSFNVVKDYLLAKIYLELEDNQAMAHATFQSLSLKFPHNTIFKEYLESSQ